MSTMGRAPFGRFSNAVKKNFRPGDAEIRPSVIVKNFSSLMDLVGCYLLKFSNNIF